MMWYRYVGLSDKLWTHGGNLQNWEIRINGEISGWGVKLEWPDFESSKYSLIHMCYMCGSVWFKRRTYTKIMMNPYMNLPLCKPQGHYNLYCDQKKGWSRETWKSPGVVKPKKIKQDPRILGKDVWRSWYFKGILTSTDWHIKIHCLNQSLLLHSGF